MRKPIINYIIFVFCTCILFSLNVSAQKKEDPGKEYISLRYYNVNNNIQYLVLSSQLKKNNQVRPQPNKVYDVYMETSDPSNFVGKIKTDSLGDANAIIPPALKSLWDSSAQHIFI
ncbi:MAG TPA: hypothetical protein VK166_15345, partial [Chitinophagaceae bacterium]|nr:hypothetical protein [Chitinophagaceae bacterium]